MVHATLAKPCAGVVSELGLCCAAEQGGNATLDAAGRCCGSGQMDACGACGGSGAAVDILGACCVGALDAASRCCAPPADVDGFGVCGGGSTSGAVALSLSIAATGGTQGAL